MKKGEGCWKTRKQTKFTLCVLRVRHTLSVYYPSQHRFCEKLPYQAKRPKLYNPSTYLGLTLISLNRPHTSFFYYTHSSVRTLCSIFSLTSSLSNLPVSGLVPKSRPHSFTSPSKSPIFILFPCWLLPLEKGGVASSSTEREPPWRALPFRSHCIFLYPNNLLSTKWSSIS